MKLKILVFLILAISTVVSSEPLSAAVYRVTGKVIENDGEPASYATLKIYSSTDSIKPIVTAVTKKNGSFTNTLKSAGNYCIKIISIGKKSVEKQFSLTESVTTADLGTIMLEEADNVLGEVSVTATKPLISMEVDRIGYDVQADEESKTAMTDEILRKVPLVTVDPDGTIKVNGSSSFKIYKNGRPNSGFTNNAKELFKVLPASMIEKIEVITEPGAREDAEGTTVILNIVTVKNTVVTGLMGGANLNYRTPSYVPNPSIWVNAQYDKFLMSAYGGYSQNNGKRDRKVSTTDTHYLETDNHEYSTNESTPHGSSGYFGIDMSLEPDTLNLFTVEFGGFVNAAKTFSFSNYRMEDALGSLIYSYNSTSRTLKNRYFSFYGSANYQRLTRLKGESLILSYRIYTNKNYGENETTYDNMVNMPVPYAGIYTDNNEVGTEQTVQFDWERPLGKAGSFDIGAKYINRNNHSESMREYIDWATNQTDFKHLTQIGAVFADYRFNLKKFGFRAGLRYEYSRLDAKFPTGGGTAYHANLNDWVPNVGIVFNPNRKNSFRLNYGTSINRPGINYLNPQVVESPNYTSYGNPDLESVRRNSISFSYTMMFPKVTMSLSANYGFSNNSIINYQWVEGDHTYSTYGNLGRLRVFSPYMYFNWRPSAKTSVMGNFSLSYSDTQNSSMNQRGSGWGYNLFARVAQQLPWKLTFQFYATYSRTPNTLYTKSTIRGWSNIYYNLGLQRSFLPKNNLTVSLVLTDPFHYKTPGYTDYTSMENLYQVTEHYRFYRTQFSVSISYRFGSMRANVKKVRSIASDDVVGDNKQE